MYLVIIQDLLFARRLPISQQHINIGEFASDCFVCVCVKSYLNYLVFERCRGIFTFFSTLSSVFIFFSSVSIFLSCPQFYAISRSLSLFVPLSLQPSHFSLFRYLSFTFNFPPFLPLRLCASFFSSSSNHIDTDTLELLLCPLPQQ